MEKFINNVKNELSVFNYCREIIVIFQKQKNKQKKKEIKKNQTD